jgi:hypothetical protein
MTPEGRCAGMVPPRQVCLTLAWMIATHVFSMNGQFWAELKDSFGPINEEIRRLLWRLNGSDRYSFILSRLPEGKRLDEVSVENELGEYLQCAGSADRMTVEMRTVMADGSEQQFVVGRPCDTIDAMRTVEVRWNEVVTRVRQNEVFNADEAAAIFVAYYETAQIPSSYVLRSVDLQEG